MTAQNINSPRPELPSLKHRKSTPRKTTRPPGNKRKNKTNELTPTQVAILKTKSEHPDLTLREIGAIADCNHVTVLTTLRRYGIDSNHLKEWKNNKADILSGLQHKLLVSITDEDIKKAPLGSRVLAAAQLFDKERIETGKSVSNIQMIHSSIADIKAMEEKINSEQSEQSGG